MNMTTYYTLWMGDLETYMDETFIKNAFLQMGEPVLHVKLIKNRFTGLPAGYCFVEFGDETSAQRCLLRLNGKIVPSSSPPKRFKLNHASYGKEHLHTRIIQLRYLHESFVHRYPRPEYSLFVGDLTAEVDDLQLFTAFSSRYPSCKAAKVVLDQMGSSKGYGFVRFGEENDQQRALREMQRYTHLGGKPIRVSLATPKKPTITAPGTQTTGQYEQYYQQYQQYQNYYWPNYSQYYNYSQPYSSGYTTDATQVSMYGQYVGYEEEEAYEQPDVEEEHDTPLDIEQSNKEYMYRTEELYEALEDSRWQSPDSLQAQIAAVSS